MSMLYDYLQQNYAPDEPILISDLKTIGIPMNTIRQQLKRLSDSGKLKRLDTGIYYLPKPSLFKSGTAPSLSDVIRCKYLREGQDCCGYLTGVAFANQIGMTTQLPMAYEIDTNKTKTKYKKTRLGRTDIILRQPRAKVTPANAKVLQLLDFLKEADLLAEIEGKDLSRKTLAYMRQNQVSFPDLKPYLSLYPDRIFRNLYEMGLLDGVSA